MGSGPSSQPDRLAKIMLVQERELSFDSSGGTFRQHISTPANGRALLPTKTQKAELAELEKSGLELAKSFENLKSMEDSLLETTKALGLRLWV